MAKHRVGGRYWGSWPELPDTAAVLFWPSSIEQAQEMAAANTPQDNDLWLIRSGYEIALQDVPSARYHVVPEESDPWFLVDHCRSVLADADEEIALVSALCGKPTACFGNGRFAELDAATAPQKDLAADIVEREFGRGINYLCPFTGAPLSFPALITLLSEWRTLIDANRSIDAAIGFAFWKQETTAALLWGGRNASLFVNSLDEVPDGAVVASWSSRVPRGTDDAFASRPLTRVEVEDGFIRSAGLGADCVPPLSIIADRRGIYFDPATESDLEHLLQTYVFDDDILQQARLLREQVLRAGISKYSMGQAKLERPGGVARRHVLVTGQVEDDRSVLRGGGAVQSNIDLLKAVRQREPEAFIVYKPHPDVEAGHRKGIVPDRKAYEFADRIERQADITSLIDMVDALHVITSLAGFEALLRGKTVTTHGVPFYAGWGLTEDLGPVPARRSRRLSRDELVAATLLLYPRYLDPVTRLPCPPDILVKRLAEGATAQNSLLVSARKLQGLLHGKLSWLKGRV